MDQDTPDSANIRTKSLDRRFLLVSELEANPLNPNKMSEQEFNLLFDNINRVGLTDPILVRPLSTGKYRIVGGHHRWEVAKLVGLEEVPVTIITDPNFDDDMEAFQAVRHNIIRGKMSADKFVALYQSLGTEYADDIASEMFGFTSEKEFKKLVKSTGGSLPAEMKAPFTDATKDVKTMKALSLVLKKLFAKFGDTTPQSYMVFDFGDKKHVWLKMTKAQKSNFFSLCEWCVTKERSVDQVMGVVLQLIADGKFGDALDTALDKLPKKAFPANALPVEQESTPS